MQRCTYTNNYYCQVTENEIHMQTLKFMQPIKSLPVSYKVTAQFNHWTFLWEQKSDAHRQMASWEM